MKYQFTICLSAMLLTSCGGVIPVPYPQSALIPTFVGNINIRSSSGVVVQLKGHPETSSIANVHGEFRTREGHDFYVGMDHFYFSRNYIITVSKDGHCIGEWEILRPGMIGHYPGQGEHDKGVLVGTLGPQNSNKPISE